MKIFISHSSKDNAEAFAVLRLLRFSGYPKAFLDIDPEEGLKLGDNFLAELSHKHSQSNFFVFLISKDWLSSTWCLAEFRAAQLVDGNHVGILLGDTQLSALPADVAASQLVRYDEETCFSALLKSVRKKSAPSDEDTFLAYSDFVPPPTGWIAFAGRTRLAFSRQGFSVESSVVKTRGVGTFTAAKTELAILENYVHVICWPDIDHEHSLKMFRKLTKPFLESARSSGETVVVVVDKLGAVSPFEGDDDCSDTARFVSLSQLESDSLKLRDYLSAAHQKYRSYHPSRFIKLNANELDPERGALKARPIDDITEFCSEVLINNQKRFVFIIGDFGSGKTTIAESIHREFSRAYLEGRTTIFPIIFYLRTLSQYDSLEEFIEGQIKSVSEQTPPNFLNEVAERGDVLVILDGFDEVASSSVKREREQYFKSVLQLANRCSHLVLTSRPSVFSSFSELNEMVGHLVDQSQKTEIHTFATKAGRRDAAIESRMRTNTWLVERKYKEPELQKFASRESVTLSIAPLSPEKIVEYIRLREEDIWELHQKTPDQIYKILSQIYDLTDIISRPLLLEMFVEVLLEGEIDLNEPNLLVGPVSLYSLYVDMHLRREDKNSRFLSPDARLEFSRAAALYMLMSGGALEAGIEPILDIVRSSPRLLDHIAHELESPDTERVLTDLRVKGFLKITADGKIAFSHKSFMEFFVADTIQETIANKLECKELSQELNYEILQFLGGFFMYRKELEYAFRDLWKLADERSSNWTNLSVTHLYTSPHIDSRLYRNFSYDGLKLSRIVFEKCVFDQVSFSRLEVINCDIQNTNFNATVWRGHIVDVQFIKCDGNLSLFGDAFGAEFIASELALRGRLTCTDCEFVNSYIAIPSAGSLKLDDTRIEGTVFTLEFGAEFSIQASSTKKCVFSFGPPPNKTEEDERNLLGRSQLSAKLSDLEDCAIFGLRLNADEYQNVKHALSRHSGFAIVDDPKKNLQAFVRKREIRNRPDGETSRNVYVGWIVDDDFLVVSTQWYEKRGDLINDIFSHEDLLREKINTGIDSLRGRWQNWLRTKRGSLDEPSFLSSGDVFVSEA